MGWYRGASICGHSDTYYYINCFYYSVFLSKIQLEDFGLSVDSLVLDKKKEYTKNNKNKKLKESCFYLKN